MNSQTLSERTAVAVPQQRRHDAFTAYATFHQLSQEIHDAALEGVAEDSVN